MSEGSKYLRIDTRTQIVVNLIATEITSETGKKLSANKALWRFIESCRPDLSERAKELAKKVKDVDSDEDE